MKKNILLFASLLLIYSCLDNDNNNIRYGFELLPIDEYTTPASFTFGEKDTIKLKYTFTNGCYSFDDIYYEYQDTTRYIAVKTIVALDQVCTESITQYDYDLIVTAAQEEDYVFKFFKGKDDNGKNIFEEVVVPVN